MAGLAALVGLFTRVSLFVFALGTWILIAHIYSYGDRHHTEAVFAIVLLALAFAPSGGRLSLDALLRRRTRRQVQAPERVDTAMWPLKLGHVLLAMTYFSTGMSKIIAGGPQWLNSYTLQGYTFMVLLVLLLFFSTPDWWRSLSAKYLDHSFPPIAARPATPR